MKSATFVSRGALALLLVAPWLGAQTNAQGSPQTNAQSSPKIRADVPFDFMVGQVMFPAGNYAVKRLQNRSFFMQATHGRESVSIATKPIRTALHPRTARLIFFQENGHYHLRELWMNSAIGIEVPEPRLAQLSTIRGSRVEIPATCTTCQ
jgi:hypothetical protein